MGSSTESPWLGALRRLRRLGATIGIPEEHGTRGEPKYNIIPPPLESLSRSNEMLRMSFPFLLGDGLGDPALLVLSAGKGHRLARYSSSARPLLFSLFHLHSFRPSQTAERVVSSKSLAGSSHLLFILPTYFPDAGRLPPISEDARPLSLRRRSSAAGAPPHPLRPNLGAAHLTHPLSFPLTIHIALRTSHCPHTSPSAPDPRPLGCGGGTPPVFGAATSSNTIAEPRGWTSAGLCECWSHRRHLGGSRGAFFKP